MAKVVIKTPDGKYVGGVSRETVLVDRITRAYLYEDGPDVDAQISTMKDDNCSNCWMIGMPVFRQLVQLKT